MNKLFAPFLPPWVETGLQPAFYDLESGTVLQQTARMYDKVNQLIRLFNELSEETQTTVTEYINKFTELKDFVDTYFDNLDVQEEINNKLDAMAESGELADIITEYLNSYIEVIFPNYGTDGYDTLGDCSIIKTANKVVMIDTFTDDATCFSSIQETLFQNNISKIDYLLITHYHTDHYGNYQRLIASGLINDARIILPRAVVYGEINATGNDIKTALTTAGLTYETADNETIDIDTGVTMRLFNASADDYQHWEDLNVGNYNTFSICAEVRINDRKLLFTGDATAETNNYVCENYIDEGNYDLLKDCHHGLTNYSPLFTRKANPNYVLVPASAGMITSNLGQQCSQTNAWASMTKNIYLQGCQSGYTRFKVGIDGVEVTSDSIASPDFGSDGLSQLYVDSTTTEELRAGTADYPFKNLSEACAFATKHIKNNVRINVVNLDNMNKDVVFKDFDSLAVFFNNNIPKGNITFDNIKNLDLRNITLDSSKITISNCSSVAIRGFISSYESEQLDILNSTATFYGDIDTSVAADPIKLRFSNIIFNNSTLAYTGTGHLLTAWQCSIKFSDTALALFKTFTFLGQIISATYVKANDFYQLEELCELYKSNSAVYSATLKESINRYGGVKMYLYDSDGRTLVFEGRRLKSGDNNYAIVFESPSSDSSTLYSKYTTITINGVNVTESRKLQVATSLSTGNRQTSTGDYIGIHRIIGIID
jgi:beta-lactamase superfamily II metal-dependent hydrolase